MDGRGGGGGGARNPLQISVLQGDPAGGSMATGNPTTARSGPDMARQELNNYASASALLDQIDYACSTSSLDTLTSSTNSSESSAAPGQAVHRLP